MKHNFGESLVLRGRRKVSFLERLDCGLQNLLLVLLLPFNLVQTAKALFSLDVEVVFLLGKKLSDLRFNKVRLRFQHRVQISAVN